MFRGMTLRGRMLSTGLALLLAPAVDAVYGSDKAPLMLDAWLGTIAFSGQIFCDFAGYTTTAIGASLVLGFSLIDNFRYPYAALGFSDFWRRWHISLEPLHFDCAPPPDFAQAWAQVVQA